MHLQLTASATTVAFVINLFHSFFFWILLTPNTAFALTQAEEASINSAKNSAAMSISTSLNNLAVPEFDSENDTAIINTPVVSYTGTEVYHRQAVAFGPNQEAVDESDQFKAKNAYQDENKLRDAKVDFSNRLSATENTTGNEQDYDARAYNTMLASGNNSISLDADDLIVRESANIIAGAAGDADNPSGSGIFDGCVTNQNKVVNTKEIVSSTEYQCVKLTTSNPDSCVLERYLDIPVMRYGGDGRLRFTNNFTFEVDIDDHRKEIHQQVPSSTGCKLIEGFVGLKMDPEVVVTSVKIRRDDNYGPMTVAFNGVVAHEDLDSAGNFNCVNNNLTSALVNNPALKVIDITNSFITARKLAQQGDGVVNIYQAAGVPNLYATMPRLVITTASKSKPTESIKQNPPGCAAQVNWEQPESTCAVQTFTDNRQDFDPKCGHPDNVIAGEGFVCSASSCTYSGWECIEQDAEYQHDMDPYITGLPITIMNGREYYQGEGIAGRCTKANAVDYQCNPLGHQQICGKPGWPNDNTEVCMPFSQLSTIAPDQCAPYANDPDCSVVNNEPHLIDQATGKAYAENITYRCDTFADTAPVTPITTTSCVDTMMCVNGECDESVDEANEDFSEAMTIFTVLGDLKNNADCLDPQDPTTCQVFKGKVSSCQRSKSGLGNDCCALTAGQVTMFDYVKGVYSFNALDTAISNLTGSGTMVEGAWSYIQSNSDTVSMVSDAFTSGYDWVLQNVTGQTTQGATGAITDYATEALFDVTMQQLKQQILQQVKNFLPEAIGDFLIQPAASAVGGGAAGIGAGVGGSVTGGISASTGLPASMGGTPPIPPGGLQINPMITGAFQVIAALYAAYQLIKLAALLLSSCDDEEASMGMKIDQGQCIEHPEQTCDTKILGVCEVQRRHFCCYGSPLGRIIMEQAGPMLDIPFAPQSGQCEGMTFNQIAQDLDWEAIDLSEWTDILMASGVTRTQSQMNVDGLTKDNEFTPNHQDADNPIDLNKKRFSDRDLEKKFKQNHSAAEIDKVDCSISPRPVGCRSDDPISPVDDILKSRILP